MALTPEEEHRLYYVGSINFEGKTMCECVCGHKERAETEWEALQQMAQHFEYIQQLYGESAEE